MTRATGLHLNCSQDVSQASRGLGCAALLVVDHTTTHGIQALCKEPSNRLSRVQVGLRAVRFESKKRLMKDFYKHSAGSSYHLGENATVWVHELRWHVRDGANVLPNVFQAGGITKSVSRPSTFCQVPFCLLLHCIICESKPLVN